MSVMRATVDYRALNAATLPSPLPLPTFESLVETLGAAKAACFAVLDLSNGYFQIPLDPAAQPFFSVSTDRDVFQPTRLMQGGRTAVGAFQATLSLVLGDLLRAQACLLYVDDILILGCDESVLVHNLLLVLTRLFFIFYTHAFQGTHTRS
jgi:hypothetical protein